MKPRVVFHADDLGVSPGVSRGIARAVEGGPVRAVSLCVTGADLAGGASLARSWLGHVDLGLHLSFTLGRALTGPIPGLTDRLGRFLPLRRVLASCAAGLPVEAQVRREVRAQLDRAGALGIRLDHLDGHHHAHVFPVIRDAVLAVAGHLRLRVPDDRVARGPKARLLRALSRGFRRRAAARRVTLDGLPFVGLGLHDRADFAERLEALLAAPPAPAFELMVHPREEDDVFRRLDRLGARGDRYRAELAALTRPWPSCAPARFSLATAPPPSGR